jgi:hypothetical protein
VGWGRSAALVLSRDETRAGMDMHADSLSLSLSPSLLPSHTLLQAPPRRAVVHRAHVVLFSHQQAATTIAPLCSNLALSCDSRYSAARAYRIHTRLRSLSPYIHYTTPHLVAGRPRDRIAYCQHALFRLSQSARSPLLPTQPTRGHNRDRFLCSPIVLLTIPGRCLPPSFDTNAAIVPANKAGPTTLLML